jgi:hypothetical protein
MLLFNEQEKAEAAWAHYKANDKTHAFNGADFEVEDDYGTRICVPRACIKGLLFENLDLAKMAQVERGLHHMRAQIEANDRGRADPKISAAMMRSQGPGILSPGIPGANGAFRQ